MILLQTLFSSPIGATVARVKCWPSEPAVPGSRPACGRDLFNHNQGSTPHSLSLSPTHCPDITEKLLKRT